MELKTAPSGKSARGPGFTAMFWLLFGVVSVLFCRSYVPDLTIASNDGPLSRLMSQCHRLPEAFSGVWQDLNTIGYREEGALASITFGLRLILGPVLFSKFYVPVAFLILGAGAWYFFRQLGLARWACILGGLAAVLNSDFFSTACWGIAARPITVGLIFAALGVLLKTASWRSWVWAAVAGFCVGMGLVEQADVGAIYSIYVAAFVIYQAWITGGNRMANLTAGASRVAIVAVFAAFLAAQALAALVTTQIEGVAGTDQDTKTKEGRWSWSTQWSLPKRETLGLIVPGLFGFRLDTPEGGSYWGEMGRDAGWQKYLATNKEGRKPPGLIRHTGSGFYAGIMVVVVAVWAGVQSFRRKDSVFSATHRKWLWFWMGIGFVSLLLAFGRFAPFYHWLFALPYFSTIRNPIKFLDLVEIALIVMFAYGVDGLWRRYMEPAKPAVLRPGSAAAAAPTGGREADARFTALWIRGSLIAMGVCFIGWLIYLWSRDSLERYLVFVNYSETAAHVIAGYSITQAGVFVVLFAGAAGLVIYILRGGFSGSRAGMGIFILGLAVVVDLTAANLPWIVYWNYPYKFATNPVIDLLRDKPYEHRVAKIPFPIPDKYRPMEELYRLEWVQHQFECYNIESLDIVQLPRYPADLLAFQKALNFDGTAKTGPKLARRWELSNTRYMLGPAEFLWALNNQIDPVRQRFRILTNYEVVPRLNAPITARAENMTAVLKPGGPYALIEFTGALPRVKLYSNWQVNTNKADTLERLAEPGFDPDHDLIVAGGAPSGLQPGPGPDPGTADIVDYHPKDITIKANASTACMLLLNDRVDPSWTASVDGKPAEILCCNYLMRGIHLDAGAHTVEFKFKPPVRPLYISVAAIFAGLFVTGFVIVEERRAGTPAKPVPVPAQRPKPAPAPAEAATPANPKPRDAAPKKKAQSKAKS